VECKSCDIDLVTETDKQVEQLLISNLKSKFPDHRYAFHISTLYIACTCIPDFMRQREDTTEIYLKNRQNPCELECFLSVHDDYSLLGCGAL
jgi:hypothetical protein